MPTASLLHHFPTKERLYGAVLSQIAIDIEASIGAALDEGDADVESVSRLCAARPTFARIAGDTVEQSSAECHRRQLITLMEHALILEQGSPS